MRAGASPGGWAAVGDAIQAGGLPGDLAAASGKRGSGDD